ncbi:MAG: 16S rRNA (uracil(1498)-N(3))-methyltransferase, partial [Anaerovoracaceae bacterium]
QKMSRFFTSPGNVGAENIQINNKEDLHHLTKVLRLRVGDQVEISDGDQWEYQGELVEISQEGALVKILDKQKFAKEPELKVTLFQGIPKQGKMELIVQKTTELGISAIVPVFMDRTVVTDNGKFSKKILRYQSVAAEAAKQCGRGIIPQVKEEIKFKEMIEGLNAFDLVLFPYENEENRTIKDALSTLLDKPKTLAMIIGPEGGFSHQEAEQLKAANTQCVSLGKTILRTETAGMAALSMCMYELEL